MQLMEAQFSQDVEVLLLRRNEYNSLSHMHAIFILAFMRLWPTRSIHLNLRLDFAGQREHVLCLAFTPNSNSNSCDNN